MDAILDEILLIAARAWHGCGDCDIPCGGLDSAHWLCPVAQYKWVAGKLEFSTRVENLSWTHHREAARGLAD